MRDTHGISNWSLEDLKHLILHQRFTELASRRNALSEDRVDSNPTFTFILDYIELDTGTFTWAKKLCVSYQAWAESNGHHPLAANRFAAEVKRAFPSAELTKNATLCDGTTRSRKWLGIKFKDEESSNVTDVTDVTDEFHFFQNNEAF